MQKIIVLFFLLLNSFAYANDKPIEDKIINFQDLMTSFRQVCFDHNDVFYENQIVRPVSSTALLTDFIDCNAMAIALDKHRVAITKDLKDLGEVAFGCSGSTKSSSELLSLLASNGEILETVSCPGKSASVLSCASSLTCNVLKSVMPLSGDFLAKGAYAVGKRYYELRGLNPNTSSALQSLKSCNENQSSCGANIAKGIFDGLYANIELLWDLPNLIGQGASAFWSWVTEDNEDATSEKGIASSDISDEDLDKNDSDPLGFIKDGVNSFMDWIASTVQSSYGCEAWSGGAPFVGTCIQPMSSWECGTCSQRLNTICGALGVVGSEIVTAFFTGGALAAGRIAVKGGSSAIAATSRVLAREFPRSARVIRRGAGVVRRAGAVGGSAVRASLNTINRMWTRTLNSPSVASTIRAAAMLKASGGAWLGIGGKVILRLSMAEPAAKVVSGFLKLSDDAMALGYSQTMSSYNITRSALSMGVPTAASVGNQARYLEQYLKAKKVPPSERGNYKIVESTDNPPRISVVYNDAPPNASSIKAVVEPKPRVNVQVTYTPPVPKPRPVVKAPIENPGPPIVVEGRVKDNTFLSLEADETVYDSFKNMGIIDPEDASQLFLKSSDAKILNENQRVFIVERISYLNGMSPRDARRILRLVETDPTKINNVGKLTDRRDKLRKILRSDIEEPELTDVINHVFDSGALGPVARSDIRIAARASEDAVPLAFKASRLDGVVDDLDLSSVVKATEDTTEIKAFGATTRSEIDEIFSSWPKGFRDEALQIIKNTENVDKRTQYMAMLLNSTERIPTKTLGRIKLLKSDPESKIKILGELNNEVNNINRKLEVALGSNNTELIRTLSRERSDLMLQRFLIEAGDDIKIDNLFAANAYNKDFTDSGNGLAHSLDNSFSMDITVKPGSKLNICRGSFGSKSAVSNASGGFFTICRGDNYLDRSSFSNVVAAPSVKELGGYTRINRFQMEEGASFTVGRNGPVSYSKGEIAGSGGYGGGIELFTSRTNQRVTLDNLAASARVPKCEKGSLGCNNIFSIQASVRPDRMGGTAAENQALLLTKRAELDSLVANLEGDTLARMIEGSRSGRPAQEALERASAQNKDLFSAMTLRREVDLKMKQGFVNGKPTKGLDLETQKFVELSKKARTAGDDFLKVKSDNYNLSNFIDDHPIIEAARFNRQDIESLYIRIGQSNSLVEQRRLLNDLFILKNQQQDINVALRGLESSLKRVDGVDLADLQLTMNQAISRNALPENAMASNLTNEEDFARAYRGRNLTSPKENGRYIELALTSEPVPGRIFIESQLHFLKKLNDDWIKNKPLIDAFGNRHNELYDEAIDQFLKLNPDAKIPYSDYKGGRFAVDVPIGQEQRAMESLQKILDGVEKKFMTELRHEKFVSIPEEALKERWFSTAMARTADEANVLARFPPGTTWKEVDDLWKAMNGRRLKLEEKFGNSTLMRGIDNAPVKIPTEEVFAILRKEKDPQKIMDLLNNKFKPTPRVTLNDVDEFYKYYEELDLFSPGLMIDERIQHDFTDAIHGGLTMDIRNLGAKNLAANAEGMARGLQVQTAIARTRRAEREVTRKLNLFKDASEEAINSVLSKYGIEARVTISGDDLVAIPNKPIPREARQEIAMAQAKVGNPSDMRISFFPEGVTRGEVAQGGNNILTPLDGAMVALDGELMEKALRGSLEAEGILTASELKQIVFGFDMRGTQIGKGDVALITNNSLSPEKMAIIDAKFSEIVRGFSGDFKPVLD